ncbi:MAG: Sialic acid TRAP transporter permease protein SiaT [Syntrophaceae bacterium PtaU1.Bin231]|nr:MAG: Sialic acid TRAP transporter permease protein SiaT [Syntrophaceae bacterium PtaU1.Bin231]HOG15790.1 TRAP transporter large permease [Syntrophales bacterium]
MIIGMIGIIVMLLLVGLGLPIAWALILVSLVGNLYLVGLDQMLASSAPMFYNYLSKYEFSVIPMFILMGNIGFHCGFLTQIFEIARKWFGRLPGGLAVSVVIAQTIFGACSGSSVAACVVIGKASIPVMRKAGYPDYLSTGVVAGSGTLAALIPPSIMICVYGSLVDQSIGKLLIGAFLPGFLSAFVFIVLIMIQGRNLPRDTTTFSWQEKIYSLRHLWVVVALVLAVIGSIYGGLCTATEAAAFGASAMFGIGFVTRTITRKAIFESLRDTVKSTGMILIIIMAAVLSARFLTLSGFSHGLVDWINQLQVPRLIIFILVLGVYLLLGCFVGATGMMVMTLPVFFPIMMNLGYDPIWFGIIVVIMCEMAYITPPVGVNLYATKSVAPDVPIVTIIRGSMPFVGRDLLVTAILYMFPQIVTFLPSLM